MPYGSNHDGTWLGSYDVEQALTKKEVTRVRVSASWPGNGARCDFEIRRLRPHLYEVNGDYGKGGAKSAHEAIQVAGKLAEQLTHPEATVYFDLIPA